MAPQIGTIRRENGVAGQISYTTDVTYPGEPPSTVQFIGSEHGARGGHGNQQRTPDIRRRPRPLRRVQPGVGPPVLRLNKLTA